MNRSEANPEDERLQKKSGPQGLIPLEEARRVDRNESGPWTFSGPINALSSDSYPLGAGSNWVPFLDCLQRMIGALYKNGYAIVKVDDE